MGYTDTIQHSQAWTGTEAEKEQFWQSKRTKQGRKRNNDEMCRWTKCNRSSEALLPYSSSTNTPPFCV